MITVTGGTPAVGQRFLVDELIIASLFSIE
jgi:hypothetical protein